MASRIRYALVGTGSRAQMYLDAIVGPHCDVAELVAWTDTNRGSPRLVRRADSRRPASRARALRAVRAGRRGHGAPASTVSSSRRPTATHADYVVAALEAGADAIVEKPLTTNEEGVREIADAVDATGPFGDGHLQLPVLAAQHRTRRGHRLWRDRRRDARCTSSGCSTRPTAPTTSAAGTATRSNSGGLLIHKSSHHFDLVNWWLDDAPDPRVRERRPAFLRRRQRRAPRPRERPAVRGSPRLAAARRVQPRSARRPGAAGALPRAGGLRRLPARPRRLRRGHHDRGQSVARRRLCRAVRRCRIRSTRTRPGRATRSRSTAPRGRAELTVVERGAVLLGDGQADVGRRSERPPRRGRRRERPPGVGASRRAAPLRAGARGADPRRRGRPRRRRRPAAADVFGGRARPAGPPASWLDGVRSVSVGLAGNLSLETGQAVPVRELGLGRRDARSTGRRHCRPDVQAPGTRSRTRGHGGIMPREVSLTPVGRCHRRRAAELLRCRRRACRELSSADRRRRGTGGIATSRLLRPERFFRAIRTRHARLNDDQRSQHPRQDRRLCLRAHVREANPRVRAGQWAGAQHGGSGAAHV